MGDKAVLQAVLLLLLTCVATNVHSAPFSADDFLQQKQTDLSTLFHSSKGGMIGPLFKQDMPHNWDSPDGGCFYQFQHYEEGDRIVTNEPCLNCTCHNSMLMCYLKVCPFSKPIGQDCTIEKRPDQCCPVITCPQVPVNLQVMQMMTSTTTPEPIMSPTGMTTFTEHGCTIEGRYYPDGAQVPGIPDKPCELCYCIRNHTACVMQECILKVNGCDPVFEDGICCPVRYKCAYDEIEGFPTTTEGGLIGSNDSAVLPATTTMIPGPIGCMHKGEFYSDGASIPTEDPCEHCYCMKSDLVCAIQECRSPLDEMSENCTPRTPAPGQCCPEAYDCPERPEVTTVTLDYSTLAGTNTTDADDLLSFPTPSGSGDGLKGPTDTTKFDEATDVTVTEDITTKPLGTEAETATSTPSDSTEQTYKTTKTTAVTGLSTEDGETQTTTPAYEDTEHYSSTKEPSGTTGGQTVTVPSGSPDEIEFDESTDVTVTEDVTTKPLGNETESATSTPSDSTEQTYKTTKTTAVTGLSTEDGETQTTTPAYEDTEIILLQRLPSGTTSGQTVTVPSGSPDEIEFDEATDVTVTEDITTKPLGTEAETATSTPSDSTEQTYKTTKTTAVTGLSTDDGETQTTTPAYEDTEHYSSTKEPSGTTSGQTVTVPSGSPDEIEFDEATDVTVTEDITTKPLGTETETATSTPSDSTEQTYKTTKTTAVTGLSTDDGETQTTTPAYEDTEHYSSTKEPSGTTSGQTVTVPSGSPDETEFDESTDVTVTEDITTKPLGNETESATSTPSDSTEQTYKTTKTTAVTGLSTEDGETQTTTPAYEDTEHYSSTKDPSGTTSGQTVTVPSGSPDEIEFDESTDVTVTEDITTKPLGNETETATSTPSDSTEQTYETTKTTAVTGLSTDDGETQTTTPAYEDTEHYSSTKDPSGTTSGQTVTVPSGSPDEIEFDESTDVTVTEDVTTKPLGNETETATSTPSDSTEQTYETTKTTAVTGLSTDDGETQTTTPAYEDTEHYSSTKAPSGTTSGQTVTVPSGSPDETEFDESTDVTVTEDITKPLGTETETATSTPSDSTEQTYETTKTTAVTGLATEDGETQTTTPAYEDTEHYSSTKEPSGTTSGQTVTVPSGTPDETEFDESTGVTVTEDLTTKPLGTETETETATSTPSDSTEQPYKTTKTTAVTGLSTDDGETQTTTPAYEDTEHYSSTKAPSGTTSGQTVTVPSGSPDETDIQDDGDGELFPTVAQTSKKPIDIGTTTLSPTTSRPSYETTTDDFPGDETSSTVDTSTLTAEQGEMVTDKPGDSETDTKKPDYDTTIVASTDQPDDEVTSKTPTTEDYSTSNTTDSGILTEKPESDKTDEDETPTTKFPESGISVEGSTDEIFTEASPVSEDQTDTSVVTDSPTDVTSPYKPTGPEDGAVTAIPDEKPMEGDTSTDVPVDEGDTKPTDTEVYTEEPSTDKPTDLPEVTETYTDKPTDTEKEESTIAQEGTGFTTIKPIIGDKPTDSDVTGESTDQATDEPTSTGEPTELILPTEPTDGGDTYTEQPGDDKVSPGDTGDSSESTVKPSDGEASSEQPTTDSTTDISTSDSTTTSKPTHEIQTETPDEAEISSGTSNATAEEVSTVGTVSEEEPTTLASTSDISTKTPFVTETYPDKVVDAETSTYTTPTEETYTTLPEDGTVHTGKPTEILVTTVSSSDENPTESPFEEPSDIQLSKCSVNGNEYGNGSSVPVSSKCQESCVCYNGNISCEILACPPAPPAFLRCVSGILEGECCPSYTCPPDQTDTTDSPVCVRDGIEYFEGEYVPSHDLCTDCYCLDGEIICAYLECPTPVGENCKPLERPPGSCCPTKYQCDSVMPEIEDQVKTNDTDEQVTPSTTHIASTSQSTDSPGTMMTGPVSAMETRTTAPDDAIMTTPILTTTEKYGETSETASGVEISFPDVTSETTVSGDTNVTTTSSTEVSSDVSISETGEISSDGDDELEYPTIIPVTESGSYTPTSGVIPEKPDEGDETGTETPSTGDVYVTTIYPSEEPSFDTSVTDEGVSTSKPHVSVTSPDTVQTNDTTSTGKPSTEDGVSTTKPVSDITEDDAYITSTPSYGETSSDSVIGGDTSTGKPEPGEYDVTATTPVIETYTDESTENVTGTDKPSSDGEDETIVPTSSAYGTESPTTVETPAISDESSKPESDSDVGNITQAPESDDTTTSKPDIETDYVTTKPSYPVVDHDPSTSDETEETTVTSDDSSKLGSESDVGITTYAPDATDTSEPDYPIPSYGTTSSKPDVETEYTTAKPSSNETTTESGTSIGFPEGIPGEGSCMFNNSTYANGENIPPRTPCQESCTCHNSIIACTLKPCPSPPPSFLRCEAVEDPEQCCPTYNCPSLTTNTTETPVCLQNETIFAHGEFVPSQDLCTDCYCLNGEVVCATLECPKPEGKNCKTLVVREGSCCPESYECEDTDGTEDHTTPQTDHQGEFSNETTTEAYGITDEDGAATISGISTEPTKVYVSTHPDDVLTTTEVVTISAEISDASETVPDTTTEAEEETEKSTPGYVTISPTEIGDTATEYSTIDDGSVINTDKPDDTEVAAPSTTLDYQQTTISSVSETTDSTETADLKPTNDTLSGVTLSTVSHESSTDYLTTTDYSATEDYGDETSTNIPSEQPTTHSPEGDGISTEHPLGITEVSTEYSTGTSETSTDKISESDKVSTIFPSGDGSTATYTEDSPASEHPIVFPTTPGSTTVTYPSEDTAATTDTSSETGYDFQESTVPSTEYPVTGDGYGLSTDQPEKGDGKVPSTTLDEQETTSSTVPDVTGSEAHAGGTTEHQSDVQPEGTSVPMLGQEIYTHGPNYTDTTIAEYPETETTPVDDVISTRYPSGHGSTTRYPDSTQTAIKPTTEYPAIDEENGTSSDQPTETKITGTMPPTSADDKETSSTTLDTTASTQTSDLRPTVTPGYTYETSEYPSDILSGVTSSTVSEEVSTSDLIESDSSSDSEGTTTTDTLFEYPTTLSPGLLSPQETSTDISKYNTTLYPEEPGTHETSTDISEHTTIVSEVPDTQETSTGITSVSDAVPTMHPSENVSTTEYPDYPETSDLPTAIYPGNGTEETTLSSSTVESSTDTDYDTETSTEVATSAPSHSSSTEEPTDPTTVADQTDSPIGTSEGPGVSEEVDEGISDLTGETSTPEETDDTSRPSVGIDTLPTEFPPGTESTSTEYPEGSYGTTTGILGQTTHEDEVSLITTTVSPTTAGDSGLVSLLGEPCLIEGTLYENGTNVPSSSLCQENCKCSNGMVLCQKPSCPPAPPGFLRCSTIPPTDECCPSYNCPQPTDPTVTDSPTCTRDGEIYADGEYVPSLDECTDCYCLGGEIVCALLQCVPPGDNCRPLTQSNNSCCPDNYECAETIDSFISSSTPTPDVAETTPVIGSETSPSHSDSTLLTSSPTSSSITVTGSPLVTEISSTTLDGKDQGGITITEASVATDGLDTTSHPSATVSFTVTEETYEPEKITVIPGSGTVPQGSEQDPDDISQTYKPEITDSSTTSDFVTVVPAGAVSNETIHSSTISSLVTGSTSYSSVETEEPSTDSTASGYLTEATLAVTGTEITGSDTAVTQGGPIIGVLSSSTAKYPEVSSDSFDKVTGHDQTTTTVSALSLVTEPSGHNITGISSTAATTSTGKYTGETESTDNVTDTALVDGVTSMDGDSIIFPDSSSSTTQTSATSSTDLPISSSSIGTPGYSTFATDSSTSSVTSSTDLSISSSSTGTGDYSTFATDSSTSSVTSSTDLPISSSSVGTGDYSTFASDSSTSSVTSSTGSPISSSSIGTGDYSTFATDSSTSSVTSSTDLPISSSSTGTGDYSTYATDLPTSSVASYTDLPIPSSSIATGDYSTFATDSSTSSSTATDYYSTSATSKTPAPFPPYPGQTYPDYQTPSASTSSPDTTTDFVLGPGACLFDGKVYVSAQQIPRDDPCDFCFCFRGDIICLQQSCPPPIPGCYEEPIAGFCCPRYECPVTQAVVNVTTTTTPIPFYPPVQRTQKVTMCEIGDRYYHPDEIVEEASGPCLECRCGHDGMMKCDPKDCGAQPMLQKILGRKYKR
ncbi:LOW QUALITY PROTEIN: serine-rich adhesin for platelets-like [Macrobrachium rosenbergii]|uniref:LOW QUALITY PROTEIN: serine-rich adhesin for platelets-like n=1 Tax=Macrobrachium rosenbergii TaxID=79674 RepID=UPI0034D6576D